MHRKSLFNKSQYVCADNIMYIDYAFLLSTKVYCLWFQMFVKDNGLYLQDMVPQILEIR